jgi:predicted ATPase
MSEPWRIELFGGLRLTRGTHEVVRFTHKRAWPLLAFLICHNDFPATRDRLREILWPEDDVSDSDNSLDGVLRSLRRELEPKGVPHGSVIRSANWSVRLVPDAITSDVFEFTEAVKKAEKARTDAERMRFLRQAARLYKGELLPGYEITWSGRYETDWLLGERERLAKAHTLVKRLLAKLAEKGRETVPISESSPDARISFPLVSSLPAPLTRFFGRGEEMAALQGLLSPSSLLGYRLVTLTGSGGCGKTRLAIEIARCLSQAFDGIWFVPLADLTNASQMLQAIVSVLGLPPALDTAPPQQIASALASRFALLILDNFEQLPGEAADSVLDLLQRLPTLTILVTSRRRLRLSGEREFPLDPLPAPPSGKQFASRTPSVEHRILASLLECESVQLFVDRAQAVRPGFQVTEENAPHIAAVCRRLEGLPLALELAAARMRMLTPVQLDTRLDQSFDVLVSSDRDTPARHRSLRAVMDMSFALLSPELQQCFAALSVFRGGWTLDAAETTVSAALDTMTELQENSLIRAEDTNGEMRYRMLETLRDYAAGKLTEDEKATLRQRHADYFCALAEEKRTSLPDSEQREWLKRLETEHDNLRTALEWTLEAEPALALRMGGALWRFWEVRGYFREGLDTLKKIIARTESLGRTAERGIVFNEAGLLAWHQGRYDEAQALLKEGLEIRQERRDRQGIANSLNSLGLLAWHIGDYPKAHTLYKESLALLREIEDEIDVAEDKAIVLHNQGNLASEEGNDNLAYNLHEESLKLRREKGDERGIAQSLGCLGMVALNRGNYSLARSLYEESLVIKRKLGNRQGIAYALDNLGTVASYLDEYGQAYAFLSEGLRLFNEVTDLKGLAGVLASLAYLAQLQSHYERAAILYGASEALCKSIGTSLPPADQDEYNRTIAAVRAGLTEESFECAWSAGRTMTLEQAITHALEEIPPNPR